MIAQIIVLVLMVMGLSAHLFKHGEDLAQKKHHFGLKIVSVSILAFLLSWGGFFSCFNI